MSEPEPTLPGKLRAAIELRFKGHTNAAARFLLAKQVIQARTPQSAKTALVNLTKEPGPKKGKLLQRLKSALEAIERADPEEVQQHLAEQGRRGNGLANSMGDILPLMRTLIEIGQPISTTGFFRLTEVLAKGNLVPDKELIRLLLKQIK